jgi:hypothetical protein
MDKKRSFFSGVMASKDPANELRKMAGARLEAQMKPGQGEKLDSPSMRDASSSNVNLRPPTEAPSPGVDSIQSLFDDGKNRSFTFLPRKQRNRKSLFPLLADKPQGKSHTAPPTAAPSPRPSTTVVQPDPSMSQSTWPRTGANTNFLHANDATPISSSASIAFAQKPVLGRSSSIISDRSTKSSPPTHTNLKRNRSSTMDSGSGNSEETPPTPPFATGGSGRNSTSTAGRSSFSNFFHIGHRMRHQDAQSPRPGSSTNLMTPNSGFASGSNSMSLSREAIALPEREDGETAMQYLKRMEEIVPRNQIPSILSKHTDPFYFAVMRSFMRTYVFFGDPLDMAIRKLLIEIVLPKETQQIDRVLQSFADRYHECNPGLFGSPGSYTDILIFDCTNHLQTKFMSRYFPF